MGKKKIMTENYRDFLMLEYARKFKMSPNSKKKSVKFRFSFFEFSRN